MGDWSKLIGLKLIPSKRIEMPKNAVCFVCGATKDEIRFRRYNEYALCEKHFQQMVKYQKITDETKRVHKKDPKDLKCCICGAPKMGEINSKIYCRKHYLQMTRKGKISETIYSPNEWVDCGDYYECILKDKNQQEVARTKIDKEDKEKFKNYKLYARHQTDKIYAHFSVLGTGRKIAVHRFLVGLADVKYSIDQVVDHINGDSLDNRKQNLRICTQHQNSQNLRKKDKVVGVRFHKKYNGYNYSKYSAVIMSNYKSIHLGYFDTKAEAILARITKEKEICGEYGPNRDLFYILDQLSPLEELKKMFPESV